MKKFDKLIEKIQNGEITSRSLDCIELAKEFRGFDVDCNNTACSECEIALYLALNEDYSKPICLTKNEKAILESIPEKYEWLARDKNGDLYVYDTRVCKSYTAQAWEGENLLFETMGIFRKLFQWIKWEDEEPYNIQKILENCEVIADE